MPSLNFEMTEGIGKYLFRGLAPNIYKKKWATPQLKFKTIIS